MSFETYIIIDLSSKFSLTNKKGLIFLERQDFQISDSKDKHWNSQQKPHCKNKYKNFKNSTTVISLLMIVFAVNIDNNIEKMILATTKICYEFSRIVSMSIAKTYNYICPIQDHS